MANPKIYQVANLQSQLSSANNNANNRVLKTGDTMTGNLTFSGTGLRILGDMSNETHSNRLLFQTSTSNSSSIVGVIPNGSSTVGQLNLYNNSDPTNAGLFQAIGLSTEISLRAAITGNGTHLPMTFYTNGSERMRLDTSGRLAIGTTDPALDFGLHVAKSQNDISGIYVDNANTGPYAYSAVMYGTTGAITAFTGVAGSGKSVDGTLSPNRMYVYNDSAAGIGIVADSGPVVFSAGSRAERMRIDSSGRLLLGTTSNTWNSVALLQVAGPSNNASISFARTDAPTATTSIVGIDGFAYDGSTYVVASTINFRAEENWTATNHGSLIQFRTTNTGSGGTLSEKMRITANGNVGIGTATADSKLHVAGSFRQTFATVPFEWTVNAGAVDFYKLNAVGYADNLIVLNGAGRVGFGTNNPSTAGRVTVANNMGMVIAHETAGVDLRIGFGNLTGNSNSYNGTVLGYRALNNCTAVSYSVAIGYDALEACTTGYEHVAVGYYALKRLTTGRGNIGIGIYAGQSLTTGNFNIAVGRAALNNANTSDYNTAIGYQSMYYTTTGYQNSAYGALSMQDNTTGYYNSAFGVNALTKNTTGYVNAAFGLSALFSNTTGIENKAFGYQALYYNTTGSYNVAIGSNAFVYNQTSSYNTMIGTYAGYGVSANSTSYYNTGLGYAACYSLRSSTANYNIGIGPYALFAATTGPENIGIGYYAGQGVTTGYQNTMVGMQAGYYNTTLTTGVQNLFLGGYTRGSSATAANQIVIGYDLGGVGDNYVTIGKAGGYIYNKYDTNATWTQTSDERLKKNIQTDNLGLSFINRLRPVTYNWKASNELDPTNPLYKTENDRDTATVMHGLIAQEVKAAMEAEGCDTFGGWDEKNGIQSISREQFISPLINAVKELSAKIALLETEIKTLKGE